MTDVVISARTAAWLTRRLDLDRIRVEIRGADPDIDHALLNIAVAASSHSGGSEPGTFVAAPVELQRESWLSTSVAADRIGCTTRRVVALIAQQRLGATRVANRYLIAAADVDKLLATRRRNG